MILSKKAISDFLQAGHAIQQNKILPVLSNVCFRGGRAIKDNLREFISIPFQHEQDFLIDEQLLSNFIRYASGDSIKININGRRLIMSDDSGAVMECDTCPVNEYPISQTPTGTPFFLSAAFFSKLKTAAKFTGNDYLTPQFEAVYVKNGKMGATDRFIMYYCDVDASLPEMILSKQACKLFDGIDNANGYQNDSYYFIVTVTGAIYGAIKTDLRYLDMAVVIPKILPPGQPINSTEIIKFNSAANSAAAGKPVNCIIKGEGSIRMDQNEYGLKFSKDNLLPGANLSPFKYSPILCNKLLTAIDENNTWAQDEHKLYLTTNDYTCIFMGLVN